MRTHRIILLILAVGFLSFSLSPQAAGAADASTASEMGALSIVVGSVVLVAAPLSMSVNTVTASASKANIVEVQATDAQGRAHVLDLPKATADKADLKAGDKLIATPKANGAVLTKDGKPVVFVVAPERGNLTHSHELAK